MLWTGEMNYARFPKKKIELPTLVHRCFVYYCLPLFRKCFNSFSSLNWLLSDHEKSSSSKVGVCVCACIIDNAIAISHTNCETTALNRVSLSLTLCSFLNICVRPFFSFSSPVPQQNGPLLSDLIAYFPHRLLNCFHIFFYIYCNSS